MFFFVSLYNFRATFQREALRTLQGVSDAFQGISKEFYGSQGCSRGFEERIRGSLGHSKGFLRHFRGHIDALFPIQYCMVVPEANFR